MGCVSGFETIGCQSYVLNILTLWPLRLHWLDGDQSYNVKCATIEICSWFSFSSIKYSMARASICTIQVLEKVQYGALFMWLLQIFHFVTSLIMCLCVFFQCRKWCKELDQGKVSDGLRKWLTQTNIKIESSAKGKNEEEMSVKEEEGEGQQVPNVASCSSSMAME